MQSPTLAPTSARAESPPDAKWLVLPSVVATQGDPKHPARAAARLLAEDLRTHVGRTFSVEQAKMRFEQQGSAPPMTASAADIDELARDAQQALYHVASGLTIKAKQDVQRALTRARRALESLNREARAAQHLLAACRFLGRAHLQRGARAEAKRQALECRRLVPDIAPEPTVHPPDVIGVLAEARAQLQAVEPISLRIESVPLGCAAYVNGRNLGPTPRELSRLSPGEYRIQAECDPGMMGRVHRVVLSNGRTVLRVDTRYDGSIQTLFDLSLRYSTPTEQRRYLMRDAIETARVVGASDVVAAWLVAESASGCEVQLDRYRVPDGVRLASARLAVDTSSQISPEALASARRQLLAFEEERAAAAIATVESPPPARVPAPSPAVAAQRVEAPAAPGDAASDSADPWPVIGGVAAGVGLATQLVGWALYARLVDAQSEYVDAVNANRMPAVRTTPELNALRDIASAQDAPPIVLGTGALLSSASVPLWLPQEEGMPAWAWLSGGLGVGLAAAGAVLSVNATQCQQDRYGRCTAPELATDLGPLLMTSAVPLLTVPVVQLFRGWTDGRVRARVGLSPRAALLRIEGRL